MLILIGDEYVDVNQIYRVKACPGTTARLVLSNREIIPTKVPSSEARALVARINEAREKSRGPALEYTAS